MTPPKLPVLEPISLNGFSLNIQYYLAQEYEDIGEACAELPAIIEWVNSELQALLEQKIIKKQQIKEVEARVFFDLKGGEFQRLGYGEKATETALEHAIVLNDGVQAVHREFAVLSGWVNRLSCLLGSLQSKLDLVRSSEATKRKLVEEVSD
jgi:hypothetical protein